VIGRFREHIHFDLYREDLLMSDRIRHRVSGNPRLPVMLCLVTLCSVAAAAAVGAAAATEQLRASTLPYLVPDLKLVTQNGKSVSLAAEMDDGRPVVLSFVFTSCEAICPLMTQTFAEFQGKLGPDSARVHLMSISIDPEEDTPARLRNYAKRFHAGPGWTFYTGTPQASIAAQKAFNVFRTDKMSHTSVIFMRSAPGAAWRRLDGFATPDDLVREYHALVASR
jgi:protein SCO1